MPRRNKNAGPRGSTSGILPGTGKHKGIGPDVSAWDANIRSTPVKPQPKKPVPRPPSKRLS